MSEKDAKAAPEPKDKKPKRDLELEGLMSEIESDIREDELKRVWRNYGSAFVTIAVVFLLGVGAYEGWRYYDTRKHAEAAMAYEEALAAAADNRHDEAKAKFAELAKSSNQPYASLARLTEAGLRVEQGDVDGAVALYAALAADPAADRMFRDMAVVLKTLHSVDTADPKTLEADLAPLLKDSTFRHSAVELTALLAAKQGDTARAAQLAQSLVDDDAAPRNLRGRAGELAALYKAGIVPAALPPPALDAGKPPSVMDLVAPAAEAEPEPAKP